MTKHISEGTKYYVDSTNAVVDYNRRSESQLFSKMIVLEVIDDPHILGTGESKLDERIRGYNITNRDIVKSLTSLPRNTIIATPKFGPTSTGLENVEFVYPFFASHISLPIKVGELVWVLREDPARMRSAVSYWMSRVAEPHHNDDINHTHSPRSLDKTLQYDPGKPSNPKFEFNDGEMDDDRILREGSAYIGSNAERKEFESLLTTTRASALHVYEAVPRYRKRPGDLAFEGSNNALITLGTIRTGVLSSKDVFPSIDDVKEKSGMIDIVVGRGQIPPTAGEVVKNTLGRNEINKFETKLSMNEGDPHYPSDRSRIALFQRTDFGSGGLDSLLGLKSYNLQLQIDPARNGAVLAKSDHLRFVARKDIEIVVVGDNNGSDGSNIDNYASIVVKSDGTIILKPSNTAVIKLGGEDADKAILCSPTPIEQSGRVTSTPLQDTMGGFMGTGGTTGVFASRVLIK